MDDPRFSDHPTRDLPRAHGGAPLRGSLRSEPKDFVVEEELGYTASGEGEHEFLVIRKRGRNTHEVARTIAKLAEVPQVAVGYAGLKDRNAVTTQHFSVQLPGREPPDWHLIEDDSLQLLSRGRHHRKIRRGGLRGNRFVIRVREVAGDREKAEQTLQQIASRGVPNYFGDQRFGRQGSNLIRVAELFAGRGRRPKREQRGLLLSAARAQLFNQVLAARVASGVWDTPVDGDVMLLAGAQRQFMNDPSDSSIAIRVAQLDVHPSGPLCGRPSRALTPQGRAAQIESDVLDGSRDWIDGLARMGLDQDRRALRLAVSDLAWEWLDDDLVLRFGLVAGAYATVVLRELVDDAGRQ